jgi:hypothetical protein
MFLDIFKLTIYLLDYELDHETRGCLRRIEEEIESKLAAIERREVYTNFKVAPSEEERETARQKYLDLAGIHKDYRYGQDFLKHNL